MTTQQRVQPLMTGMEIIASLIETALDALELEPQDVTDLEIVDGVEPGHFWVNLNDDAYYVWIQATRGLFDVWIAGSRCSCGSRDCAFCSWAMAWKD